MTREEIVNRIAELDSEKLLLRIELKKLQKDAFIGKYVTDGECYAYVEGENEHGSYNVQAFYSESSEIALETTWYSFEGCKEITKEEFETKFNQMVEHMKNKFALVPNID